MAQIHGLSFRLVHPTLDFHECASGCKIGEVEISSLVGVNETPLNADLCTKDPSTAQRICNFAAERDSRSGRGSAGAHRPFAICIGECAAEQQSHDNNG